MSWKICFPGGGEAAQNGLAKVCAAVASHEGYSPEIGDVIPLTEESDLIILALRQGNACQKGAVDSLAGQAIPGGAGYLITFRPHPFFEAQSMILIASETEEGLLRGCMAFTDEYLPEAANGCNPFREGFPEKMLVSE